MVSVKILGSGCTNCKRLEALIAKPNAASTPLSSSPPPNPRNNEFSRRQVGRQRDVVQVADSQQSLDVRFVRMGVERVDQENDAIDLPLCDPRRDLCITSHWSRQHAFDLQARRPRDTLTGCARSDQTTPDKRITVSQREQHHIVLLAVVGDQRQRWLSGCHISLLNARNRTRRIIHYSGFSNNVVISGAGNTTASTIRSGMAITTHHRKLL